MEDKRRSVLTLYAKRRFSIEQIAKLVCVRKATALEWTKTIRQEEERQLNETIFEMWLACHTQQEIAEATGLTRQRREVLRKV